MDSALRNSAAYRKRVLIIDPDRESREIARKSLDLPDLEIDEASGLV